jgi:hypothetical protein
MDATLYPPEVILTSMDELVTITANMIQSYLQQEHKRLKNDTPQNTVIPSREERLCLPEAIDYESSTFKSREYRAPVCSQR